MYLLTWKVRQLIGMRAAEVRLWLVENEKKLPYSIRLENNVEWIHLDVRQVDGRKIVFFNG
jgi:hypothetical protein